MSTPFHRHFATTDPETGYEAIRQVYARAGMGVVRDRESFGYSQDLVGDAELTLGRFQFLGTVAGHMVQEETFSVILPRAGFLHGTLNQRESVGPGMFVIQPGQHYQAQVQQLISDSMNLQDSALAATARTAYGDDAVQVVFEHSRPVSERMASYWEATHAFVRQAMADPEIANVPLLRGDLRHRMAVATLESFALSGDREARRISVAARQAAYTKAVEFLRATLSLPITVEDVARHAEVSMAELTRAFRAHIGITPGAYLRGLRLAAAHEDLVVAEPGAGDTVRRIAARWGFAHPGDFARRYRVAYGVNPAQTLHQ